MQDIIFYSSEFSDLNKLAEKQFLLGNKEVVLCKNFSEKELSELKERINSNKFSVHFFTCHLLYKNDSKELNKFRNKTDFIAVLGGNVSSNSFAASSKKIDFLIKPCIEGRLSFDTAIARTAKENQTELIIPFSQFLENSNRVSLARNYSFCLKIADKFKLNPRVVSFAKNINGLRSLNDLEYFKKFLEKKFESAVSKS